MIIKKIVTKSFGILSNCSYKVKSGQIFGRSCEGKTTLLTAFTGCFLNSRLDGKKLTPLPDHIDTGWVKIEYEVNGEQKEAYRTWTRKNEGISSSTSINEGIVKHLFLAIANPLYIFSIENSDRIDLLIDWHYFDYSKNLFDELPSDISDEIVDYAKSLGKISLYKIRTLMKDLKAEIKTNKALASALTSQMEILQNVENADTLKTELSEKSTELANSIAVAENNLRMLGYIYNQLLKNAVNALNPILCLTQFTEDGKVLYDSMPADRLSSGERLDCGLDIANAIASKYTLVPPTLIDNATAFGHGTINKSLFPNLSQIITASYADVDLCELNGKYLSGLDKGWNVNAPKDFRPEVKVEMLYLDE